MGLVGDNEILIEGFGINRQVLKNMKGEQLQVRYLFFNGVEIINIPFFSTKQESHFLTVYEDRIGYITLTQNPPQLLC